MAYTKYSLTPANNTATPPDGAPEGMLPSAVNDTMRDMMAQIRDCGDGIRDGTYTMTAPKITGGTITGVAFTGNTFTNPVITGGSINNTPIGATTANTGRFSDLTDTGLTSGRVIYATTGGNLTDDADFTFNGTTVTMANDASINSLVVGKGIGSVSTNTALGVGVMSTVSAGSVNTGIGYNALSASTITGTDNTAVGNRSLAAVTSGSSNTAVGSLALYNSTANSNTAVGKDCGRSTTSGANNSFLGAFAGYANTTGANNVAIGLEALQANTTASFITALGYQAGYSNITSNASTYVGYQAGYSATSAGNTLVGTQAGYNITSGAKNTILGRYDGNQGSLDIRTASNYIVLSDGDGNPRLYSDGSGRIRIGGVSGGNDIFRALQTTANTTATFENSNGSAPTGISVYFSGTNPNNTTQDFLNCGDTLNAKLYIYSNGTVTNRTGTYNSFSDIKLKQDIVDAGSQWNDIKSVRVRKFRLKDDVLANPESKPLIGVIAQELELTSAGLVEDCTERDGQTTKAVKYSILYMKAVKALQEAMERIETLEAKVTALENK